MPVACEGHIPTLEDFWVGMQDNFKAKYRGYCRLTTTQMIEFYLEDNIPKHFRDDGQLLDLTYMKMIMDKRLLSLIRWSEKENVKIEDVIE